jgi:hypothetical protein
MEILGEEELEVFDVTMKTLFILVFSTLNFFQLIFNPKLKLLITLIAL